MTSHLDPRQALGEKPRRWPDHYIRTLTEGETTGHLGKLRRSSMAWQSMREEIIAALDLFHARAPR
jgi:hypothetical protein